MKRVPAIRGVPVTVSGRPAKAPERADAIASGIQFQRSPCSHSGLGCGVVER